MDNKNPNADSEIINAALEMLISTKSKASTEKIGDASQAIGINASQTVKNIRKSDPEFALDWRLSVSQIERFQVIQRL